MCFCISFVDTENSAPTVVSNYWGTESFPEDLFRTLLSHKGRQGLFQDRLFEN